jgi:DNA-binding transcriptional LysR family regulator
MAKVTLACVPEHFSLPLHLPASLEKFRADAGVDLNVRIAKGGTGEMVGLLESGEIDIAVALTEGLLAGEYC